MRAPPIPLDHGIASVTALPVATSCHVQDLPQTRVRRALPRMGEIPAGRADEGAAVRALLPLDFGLNVPWADKLPAVGLWTVPTLGGRRRMLGRPIEVDPSVGRVQGRHHLLGWERSATASERKHAPVLEGDAGHLSDAGMAILMLACRVDHLGWLGLIVASGTSSAKRGRVSARLHILRGVCYIDTDACSAFDGVGPLLKARFSFALKPFGLMPRFSTDGTLRGLAAVTRADDSLLRRLDERPPLAAAPLAAAPG